MRSEIKEGDATLISTIENGAPQEYKIRIEKIYQNNNSDNKSMVIKVEDERLLNETGGIVQGMSGSPIIQNGKIIGAVTHVLIDEVTNGYGVFIQTMLTEGER